MNKVRGGCLPDKGTNAGRQRGVNLLPCNPNPHTRPVSPSSQFLVDQVQQIGGAPESIGVPLPPPLPPTVK